MDDLNPSGFKPGERPVPDVGPSFHLTLFPAPARWATRGTFEEVSWTTIIDRTTQPSLWPGGGSIEYAGARLPALTFARYRDDTRVVTRDEGLSARETSARVEAVHGLIVEYEDEPAVDAPHLLQWWGAYGFVAYTTGFNEQPMGDKPEGPRWRVLIPFSEPVDLPTGAAIGRWARHPRQHAGIVAASTEDPWRAREVAAVAPGGYRWLASAGPALDPKRALQQLEEWLELDRTHRASVALEGTSIAEVTNRFMARHHDAARRPFFRLPGTAPRLLDVGADALQPGEPPLWRGLGELLTGLWPGRVAALLGTGGSGRTALALQLARSVAADGHPVLIVLTRMGGDEAVARLLASGARGAVAPWTLLQGAGAPDAVAAMASSLAEQCPALHLWTPAGPARTVEELVHKVRAVSDAHGRRPPLVLVDGVEGWAIDDPERGVRTLASGLRDLAHAGTVEPEWPGAAVWMVAGSDLPALASAEALSRAFASGALGPLGPLEADASAVLLLAPGESSGGGTRPALVVLAKNRDGLTGSVELRFDAVHGRFDEV